MANQPEVSNFDAGVYQLETTDVVEGGFGGVDNKPLLNLANRTLWLKDQNNDRVGEIADMQTQVDAVDDRVDEEILDRISGDSALLAMINAIKPFIPKYRGYFTGLNVSMSPQSLGVGGNVSSAVVQSGPSNNSQVLVTIPSMGTNNYFVRISVQSLGVNTDDNTIYVPVFDIISQTQFVVSIREGGNFTQNLRVHLEITAL